MRNVLERLGLERLDDESQCLPLPGKALILGTHQGRLLVRTNQDWVLSESLVFGIGSLVSIDLN